MHAVHAVQAWSWSDSGDTWCCEQDLVSLGVGRQPGPFRVSDPALDAWDTGLKETASEGLLP